MAVWSSSNIMLTKKGQELLSKVQAGVGQLSITRVVTGSGRVATENLFNQTAVSSIKQAMTVTKVTTMSTGSNLELRVTNSNVTESYKVNQIGVYATHPDLGEVLYMIAQCDEGTADIIPLPSVTPVTMNYMFYLIHSSATQVDITVDPAGFVSIETFEEHVKEFQELCDFIGYDDSEIYGVEVDFANKKYTRLGANVGLNPGADFDKLSPWGGRKRCIVANDGTVLASYGSANYSETGYTQKPINIDGVVYPVGTHAQVMIKQPKFWYRTIPVKKEKQSGQQGYSLLKARYYISTTPRPGFKVFPLFQRGIPLKDAEEAYLPAYKGCIFDVTTPVNQVESLTIGDVPEGFSSISIGFDSGYGEKVQIPLPESASIEEIYTTIGKYSFSTVDTEIIISADAGIGGSTHTTTGLRFNYKEPGLKGAIQISWVLYDGSTSTQGLNFHTETQGAGGYTQNDSLNPDITEDMLSSVAGVIPATGRNSNMSRDKLSKMCKNRNSYKNNGKSRFRNGFGWQQKDLAANMCSAMLFLIEYASLDAQNKVGAGITSSGYGKHHTGETSSLGNSTGKGVSVEADTNLAVSYRGEENLWGFMSQFEEGLNMKADVNKNVHRYYFSTSGIYSDSATDSSETYAYKSTGFTVAPQNGYTNRIGYSEDFDWGFLPTLAKGSSDTPIHSYMVSSWDKGTWVSISHELPNLGQRAGLCSRQFDKPVGYEGWGVGGSLMFVPDPTVTGNHYPTEV